MDPLSQVIGLLRPREPFWRAVEAHGSWSIRYQPANVIVFGQMLAGVASIQREDGVGFTIEHGDFLLMMDPPTWRMRVGENGDELDYKTVIADPGRLLSADASAPVTRFVTGNFSFSPVNSDLLQALMRPIVLVRSED